MASFITPVKFNLGSTGSWLDVDVSGQTGYSASRTGAILRIVNNSSNTRTVGLRKNGSTDNRTNTMAGVVNGAQFGAIIGLDGSGIFEAQVDNTSQVDIWLVGWVDSEGVALTNGVDKSTGTTGSFQDVDISGDTGANTAIAAVFEVVATAGLKSFGLRKNGSTDSRTGQINSHIFAMIGVDGSEICEQNIGNTAVDLFLVFYFLSGVTLNTNATDRSTASTGSYQSVTALPAGAIGGIYEVNDAGGAEVRVAVRKIGDTNDWYYNINRHAWYFVEADASRQVEQKIAGTDGDLFELGYFSAENVTSTPALGALSLAGVAAAMRWGVNVALGTLSLAGLAPSLVLATTVAAGTLSLAGQAPSLVQRTSVAAGTLSLAGAAPTIIQDQARAPALGALSLAGQAPTLAWTLSPASGALSLAGLAPVADVAGNLVAAPAASDLALAGTTPTLALSLSPAVGALSLDGLAPNLNELSNRAPAAGVLTLDGLAPTVIAASGAVAAPGVGVLSLGGLAPALADLIRVAAGTLTLTGAAPVVTDDVFPAVGQLSLAGTAPTLQEAVRPATGDLALAGTAPAVKSTIAVGTGGLLLAGNAPTATLVAGVTPDTGLLSLAGAAPTLGFASRPAAGDVALAGSTPAIQITILVASGALALDGLAPTLVGAVSFAPATGDLSLAGLTPTVTGGTAQTPIQFLCAHFMSSSPSIAFESRTPSITFAPVTCEEE